MSPIRRPGREEVQSHSCSSRQLFSNEPKTGSRILFKRRGARRPRPGCRHRPGVKPEGVFPGGQGESIGLPPVELPAFRNLSCSYGGSVMGVGVSVFKRNSIKGRWLRLRIRWARWRRPGSWETHPATRGALVTVDDVVAATRESRLVSSVDIFEKPGHVLVLVWPRWWAWPWSRRMVWRVRERLQGRMACGIMIFVGIGKL